MCVTEAHDPWLLAGIRTDPIAIALPKPGQSYFLDKRLRLILCAVKLTVRLSKDVIIVYFFLGSDFY